MAISSAEINRAIQDAILKLCTQNVMFSKSLEIDGIVCISPEGDRDIIVKMHRTIVKPNRESQINTLNTPASNMTQTPLSSLSGTSSPGYRLTTASINPTKNTPTQPSGLHGATRSSPNRLNLKGNN